MSELSPEERGSTRYYVLCHNKVVANCGDLQHALRTARAESSSIAGSAQVFQRRSNGTRQLVAVYRWGELQP